MLGMPRFKHGCMRATEESTKTSLISPVSPSMPCFRGSRWLRTNEAHYLDRTIWGRKFEAIVESEKYDTLTVN
jgi:hypothetical protein